MKVSIINSHDSEGGAARAAYRIHCALGKYGVDSRMLVNESRTHDSTVFGPENNYLKVLNRVRGRIGALLPTLLKTENPVLHSPAVLPTSWCKKLNLSDVDIVHLHWVNGEMMSIKDIGRIQKPLVWTLHDMWAFCGGEHYTEEMRWVDGYKNDNRPPYESGFDLNRWVSKYKFFHWKAPMQIVTPSRWLADCVKKSSLMNGFPVEVIPNAIDTEVWSPIDQGVARTLLDLPTDVPILLFGAMGGSSDSRKGYDLLRSALQHLHGTVKDLHLVVFGQRAPDIPENLGFQIHYMGHLHDDVSLKLLYSAADAMVIPSRQDNLPNTGVESLSCGTPVIAFDTCGLPDIVCHKETGYLAKAFDTEDLANGIKWVLYDSNTQELRDSSRKFAVKSWSYNIIAPKYLELYKTVISKG